MMDLTSFSPGLILLSVVGLALAPFVAVMVTSFTKIVVVLTILRNALGLQQTPPSVVINGLAIVLTIYVMYPVMTTTSAAAIQAIEQQQSSSLSIQQILAVADASKEPLREFLIEHTSPSEIRFFEATAKRILIDDPTAVITSRDFLVVIPAFTVSELTEAFQIGFLIFLPFLVIDLVVSNILLAMGMSMLSPVTVSLPFKLLLFVLIDGWAKLIHGLVLTYA